MKRTPKVIKRQTEQWLNERWFIANMKDARPQDMEYRLYLRYTVIHKNDRICQFEIQKIQPEIEFVEVEHLDDTDRGGIGSTGRV